MLLSAVLIVVAHQERLSRRWDDFHTEAYSLIRPKHWETFTRSYYGVKGERLRKLVSDAAPSLTKMAGRCAEAQR